MPRRLLPVLDGVPLPGETLPKFCATRVETGHADMLCSYGLLRRGCSSLPRLLQCHAVGSRARSLQEQARQPAVTGRVSLSRTRGARSRRGPLQPIPPAGWVAAGKRQHGREPRSKCKLVVDWRPKAFQSTEFVFASFMSRVRRRDGPETSCRLSASRGTGLLSDQLEPWWCRLAV